MTKKYVKQKLKEYCQFRNQLIFLTLLFFMGGTFLLMDLNIFTEDAAEGYRTLFGFGIILGLLAIYNVFTYRENKKNFKKLYG